MSQATSLSLRDAAGSVQPDKPVLIAGPTASGKSGLALEIARQQGGVIVNADASQVYDCWRILTARPSREEEKEATHLLYGHVQANQSYSTGHWLRDVLPCLKNGPRPIIVGGTGLYFAALTRGLADIPEIPAEVRRQGNEQSLDAMLDDLDAATRKRIDTANRARVQRAWEVYRTTGRGLAEWQADTPAPALPLDHAQAFVFDAPKDWLSDRIEKRFDLMLDEGVLDEVRAVAPVYNPALPAHRAIGAPELMAHISGKTSLNAARDAAIVATRQYAKRQRTWLRSRMQHWVHIDPRQ